LLATVGVAGIGFTVTLTVPGNEVQPFNLARTVYVPDAAVVADVTVAVAPVAAKLFGPDHVNVAPTVLEVADKSIVLPAQIGVTNTVATGVAGGLGSDKEIGPTAVDTQVFKVTVMLL
jgi:hypothetical protein